MNMPCTYAYMLYLNSTLDIPCFGSIWDGDVIEFDKGGKRDLWKVVASAGALEGVH